MNLCYKLAFICGLLITSFTIQAQVLDLESTTEGALLPRMTTAQRMAISTPSQSETVYDTETKSFWYWEDSQWNELGANASSVSFFNCGVGMSGDTIANTLPAVRDTISLTSTEMISNETHVSICLDVDHTFVGDLSITLISPGSGIMVDLTSGNGNNGDNFIGTCFTATGKSSIISILPEDAPFTDVFLPEGSLADLVGQPINGDWTLEIIDNAGGDEGIFNTWELNFTNSFSIVAQKALFADISTSTKEISDADANTKIQVEESLNEDVIRFDIGNLELLTLRKSANNRLLAEPQNGFFGTFYGNGAGVLATGDSNTLFGHQAGSSITSGFANTIIGTQAGQNLVTGTSNVFLGKFAGRNATGSGNIFLGSGAGQNYTGNDRLEIETINGNTPLILGEFNTNRVGISTSVLATGFTLSVGGKIACEEVLVDLIGDWPDYVFTNEYKLNTLEEVQAHIDTKGHLPGVPSAQEIEDNGIQIGEMNKVLMEKVEELTLYILQQEKRIKALENNK